MTVNEKLTKVNKINVDAVLKENGLEIIVNGDKFLIEYPKEIWQSYADQSKEVFKDNIAYSSTIFLPQMINLTEIVYQTGRPIAETFLYKNGIYDMPICAIVDHQSSLKYVKSFFNTRYVFINNQIKTALRTEGENKAKSAVIPFSFGKESMLSLSLCQEIGIKPILVNFIEPSNEYEYFHKKKLIEEFEKETKIKVYTVKYNPGIFRYGKYWGLETELGWGLQTTEYALLSLPFVDYFQADYIVFGNEQSCNDIFFDKEGMLTYKAGYDQHTDWTAQQGLLASLILGRKVQVISFMEPLYELAINKILHHRYPEYGKYQMSCMADTENAKERRWCHHCTKCGYLFALSCAFNLDLKKIGFTENLFDQAHAHIYDHFFNYDPQAPAYGSQEELGLAFYLATLNGHQGYSINLFREKLLKKFEQNKDKYIKKYLGINSFQNMPEKLADKILKIYREELKDYIK